MADKVKLTRKLGQSQFELLTLIGSSPKSGLTKDHMLSSDWRVVDRLETLGLVENRFVPMQGPTYFVNDAGRALLSSGKTGE